MRRPVSSVAPRRQRGVVLLVLAVMLAMGGMYFLIRHIAPTYIESSRAQTTNLALQTARDALLGYAATYRERQVATGNPSNRYEVYGFLPLPDLGTTSNANSGDADCGGLEGCSAASNSTHHTIVGRFPWRKLGTGPLRDGHGECLWYVLSGSHQMINQAPPPMNGDTLAQLDVVTTTDTEKLKSLVASPHDRPLAIIFSPGPLLGNQNRGPIGNDVVTECGGNYNPANYLDPNLAAALLDASGADTTTSAYFTGNRATDTDPATGKPALAIATQGTILGIGGTLKKSCSTGEACEIKGNDLGLALTSEALFAAVRNNANFRADINAVLDRMANCLRDEIADGGGPTGYGRLADVDTAATDANPCYGKEANPLGYYPHYKELVFVARGNMTVNGETCAAALVFANQRTASQRRDGTNKDVVANADNYGNYLEDVNRDSFKSNGTVFSGPTKLERTSIQGVGQDIVRCIPAGAALTTVVSPNLAAAGVAPLASYSPGTGTLTLGEQRTTSISTSVSGDLYGCAWFPETHAMGSGLRTYFTFRINDAGGSSAPHEGFAFAIVDGDNNGTTACGGARHHQGYSGNNLTTPFIVPPKIGFEIDPRINRVTSTTVSGFYFNPPTTSTLANGRNDPPSTITNTDGTTTVTYRGGHAAIVYWGGETQILANATATGTFPPCTLPRVENTTDNKCYLPQEEDDNVHGEPANARTGFPPPPANPAAPTIPLAVPPDTPAGVYKLDPNRSQVPANQDFHVRLELSRGSATYELPTARVATTGNLDLASPGASIDGVYLAAGDIVLVKDQTSSAANGIYVWNDASKLMTRATTATAVAQLNGALIQVQQGTLNARTLWRQNALLTALGTDPQRWANTRAKVATTANLTLSSPGTAIDGIRLVAGDRVLVKSQTTATENGVYVWNGATATMTRATDADTSDKLNGLAVQIQQGSQATAWWRFDGSAWTRLSVRVATQANLDLTAPGAAIDGISLAAGDRVLVKSQTSAAQNGIYTWAGAAVPMTRAIDAATAAQLANAMAHVLAGTDLGRTFRQNGITASDTAGAQAVRWVAIDSSPRFTIEAWILPDSTTDSEKIIAMKNTTRAMSQLYPTYVPHLRDYPVIGYPFRNVRIGFTTGQQTTVTDQNFTISNIATTWLE